MAIKEDQWVWAIVYGGEGNEQLLAQHEAKNDITFIPCFLSKEDAVNGMGYLTKDKTIVHTVQAIIFDDLKQYSKENEMVIFILKASGEIREKITDHV